MAEPHLVKSGLGMEPANTVLVHIDHQHTMYAGIASDKRDTILKAAVLTTKMARIMGLKIILVTIGAKRNGECHSDIVKAAGANAIIIDRKKPSFDIFQDKEVNEIIGSTGCTNILMSGLWTSMCMCFSVEGAIARDYKVFCLIDACGDYSKQAHKAGLDRMKKRGAIPTCWMSATSELMNGWDDPHAGELSKEVFSGDAMMAMNSH